MRSKYGIAMLIALAAGLAIVPVLAVPQMPIDIVNFSFQPATATEEIGVPITWTNDDEFAHTVTFDTLDIDSGAIEPGQTFTATLALSGSYTYHCSIHSNMSGTINAVAQQAPPPTLSPRLWLPLAIQPQG